MVSLYLLLRVPIHHPIELFSKLLNVVPQLVNAEEIVWFLIKFEGVNILNKSTEGAYEVVNNGGLNYSYVVMQVIYGTCPSCAALVRS